MVLSKHFLPVAKAYGRSPKNMRHRRPLQAPPLTIRAHQRAMDWRAPAGAHAHSRFFHNHRITRLPAASLQRVHCRVPTIATSALGGDAEQSRQCACDARGAGEWDGASGRGGRGLSRRAGGEDAERVPLDWAMTQNNLGAVVRWFWRWKSRSRGGRPKVPLEIRQLIREILARTCLPKYRSSSSRSALKHNRPQ
jgi:hypothetical protein